MTPRKLSPIEQKARRFANNADHQAGDRRTDQAGAIHH